MSKRISESFAFTDPDAKMIREAYCALKGDVCYHPIGGCGECEYTRVAQPDNVNHPGHYESGKFECIEVMEETQGTEAVLDFCICNAFKYLYRHKRKNGLEDIKKARWYLDKYIEIVQREAGADDR